MESVEAEIAYAPDDENSQPSVEIWLDLKRQLPNAAKMLGCEESEIQIMTSYAIDRSYMDKEYRDIPIETSGPIEGLEFIQKNRKHCFGYAYGYGLIKYKTRDADMEYVVFIDEGIHSDRMFFFVKKKDIFRYVRYCKRQNRQSNPIEEVPILEEGVLEDVISNTIGFLIRSREIEKYGVKIKRGLILNGKPGNGKTMLCRYIQKICSQKDINWGVITSADIDSAYHNQSLNNLFDSYTVSFFDDIDVAYMNRKKGNAKMACSLLTAMDGIKTNEHRVRIFTTNEEITSMDDAFVRPGRIDRMITIRKPTADMRKQLVLTWPEEIVKAIDMDAIIKQSDNFSFAELEAIRTTLVTNKVLGDGTWDLEFAFNEFNERKEVDEEVEKQRAGFGSKEDKPSKKKRSYKRNNFDFEKFKSDLGISSSPEDLNPKIK